MWKRSLTALGLAILVAGTASCIFDPKQDNPQIPPEPGKTFEPLTTKEHVLNNLELAYNRGNVTKYDELLDPNFTFFFSPGDVGGTIPEQWGRTEELEVARLLFDKGLNDPVFPRCRSIRMDLKFESGVQWVDFIPAAFPDETWYTTTIFYEFTFEMDPDNTYIAVPGAKVQFTVRNAGTDQSPHWQLVEFRDLGTST